MAIHCKGCGAEVAEEAQKCSTCGTIQDSFSYKSRIAAATLAIFGGAVGAHRFYLGQWWGIFYLLFFWTYIPSLIGLVEGIVFLFRSQDEWNRKYNQGISAGSEKGTVVVVIALLFPAVAVLGILAAIALPQYQDYVHRAKVAAAHSYSLPVTTAVGEYVIQVGEWPANLAAMGMDADMFNSGTGFVEVERGVVYIWLPPEAGIEGELIYVPTYTQAEVTWSCLESTIMSRYLPSECR